MNQPHVLVIEDEPKIALLVRDYLLQDGIDVTLAGDGVHGVALIENLAPHLVILDWMLPGESGINICRTVRQSSTVPIIMLTARVDEADRLEGFEAGADDYVCKPFSPPELVARVRSVLRRAMGSTSSESAPSADPTSHTAAPGKLLVHGELCLNQEQFSCQVRNQPVSLTPVEFRLLREMMAHPGKVYSRYQLMRVIYQDHRVVSDRTIDSHVSNLRRKLAEHMDGAVVIHSTYSVGYRLE